MTTVLSRFDRKKLFLILTVAILTVTSLVFTFLVFPNVKTYLEVAKKETSLSQTTDNGGHMEKQLNQLRQEIEQLQRRLHGDMASLPEKEIEAHIVGKLQQISWQNNIQLAGIEPSPGATIESFHEILFQVTLAGDYMDMYAWLMDVNNELGFVLIKKYEMKPIENLAQNPRLSVNLTMATYRAVR